MSKRKLRKSSRQYCGYVRRLKRMSKKKTKGRKKGYKRVKTLYVRK